MHPVRMLVLAGSLACLVACSGKGSDTKAKQDAGASAVPIAMPRIGIDSIKRMNYVEGSGQSSYERAATAYYRKPRDWSTVRSGCDAALAKDPTHLDAHRVLASALAHAGEHAAAVDHLVAALAGDYLKVGPSLATDPDLKEFLATPHGVAINELAAKIGAEVNKRVASGVLVVGRRKSFYWPRKEGDATTSRGELYAFDRETRKYFRLTHTDHQVAGFVRAASGKEVAVWGFDKIDRNLPKVDKDKEKDKDKAPEPPPPPPTFGKSWLQVMDTTEWKPIGAKVTVPAAHTIMIGYAEGDRLLIATAPTVGVTTTWSVDRTTGKLSKNDAPPPPARLEVTVEEAVQIHAAPGIAAQFASTTPGARPTASTIKTPAGKLIEIPESHQVTEGAIAPSPDGARVAFATAVDPCAKDTAPSLYVADAKTGALKHLLTARSRFAMRWLDATSLAYEDGEGAIRIWDASSGRESARLENKSGIALGAVSRVTAPICKQAPPDPAAGTGSGDEPPLPPEEGSGAGSSSGPVTSPT